MDETTTKTKNSVESNRHKLMTLAPSTFRMPISFVLCSATKLAIPNKPKQEIKMAGIPDGRLSCAADHFIDGQFPGNKGSYCQPDQIITNRIKFEL